MEFIYYSIFCVEKLKKEEIICYLECNLGKLEFLVVIGLFFRM